MVIIIDPDLEPSYIGLIEGEDINNLSLVEIRNPELLIMRVIIGEKYGKPIYVFLNMGTLCNILVEDYIIGQGLNMEFIKRIYIIYNTP